MDKLQVRSWKVVLQFASGWECKIPVHAVSRERACAVAQDIVNDLSMNGAIETINRWKVEGK